MHSFGRFYALKHEIVLGLGVIMRRVNAFNKVWRGRIVME